MPDESPSLPLLQVQHIDRVCDRFEAAWKAGLRPRIDEFLRDAPSSESLDLLRELLVLDLDYRRRLGEKPTLEEYRAQHPELRLDPFANLFAEIGRTPASPSAALLQGAPSESETPDGQRVEKLLAAHAEAGNAFRPQGGTTDYQAASSPVARGDAVGAVIAGRYKLLEAIGEGGMGTVYRAGQTEPVKRQVALKLVKPGMDSKDVLTRFEAERQALALMDHPNIARVLDAGSTESGRLFFVMELVKGVPITQYCDQHRLTPRQRLELFVPVCQAIQHAHQKGIIHRDIKPSNVLVAMYDDRPVPKVIDFGLAKAAGQLLTEKTLITRFGTLVGTPEYMSPEQASLNNLDFDTRSDVYALGVLLYELLTGTTPVDRKSLGNAALLEVLRIVREVEAPRPSTKLSSSETLPSIAANRNIEPAKLTKLMQGELDWVLLKALEKDRARRYETANGLARDIQRYLSDEVVEARPPSTGYRLRKLARRHKAQVIAASLVLLALLAGITGTTFGLIRAEQQRGLAEAGEKLAGERLIQVEDEKKKVAEEKQVAEAVRDFLQHKLLGQSAIFNQANALLLAGRSSAETKHNPTIGELLDRSARELAADKIDANFPRQPRLQAELLFTVGDTYRGVGEYGSAIAFLSRAANLLRAHLGADHPDTLFALNSLALAYDSAGNLPRARELHEQVTDASVKRLGADDPFTLGTLNNLALTYLSAGDKPRAIEILERVRDASVKKLGADHQDTLAALANLAYLYGSVGNVAQATALLEEVSKAQIKKLGADHPDTLVTLENLAGVYRASRKLPQAIRLLEQVRDANVEKQGADHPDSLTAINNLGTAYKDAGEFSRAIELLKQARDGRIKKLGADHSATLATLNNLAVTYRVAGKLPQSIETYEQLRKLRLKKLGADDPDTIATLCSLAAVYQLAGNLPDALPLFEQAATGIEKREYRDSSAEIIIPCTIAAYAAALQFDKAVAWQRKWLAVVKQKEGVGSPAYTAQLAMLGLNLVRQKKYAIAEPILRECLELREKLLEKKQAAPWQIACVKSMLGEALLGQKKPVEAEPFVVAGYEGLKLDEKAIPEAVRRERMTEAIQRLIDLATAMNNPDDVKKWQAEQAKYPAQKPVEKK